MDQTKACLRFICQINGLYPKDPEGIYAIENVVDLILVDFYNRVFTRAVIEAEKKEEFMLQQCLKEMPRILHIMAKNLSGSIEAHGFAAGKTFSMADIAVMTFLSVFCFHPMRYDAMKAEIEKHPVLNSYMVSMWEQFDGYF